MHPTLAVFALPWVDWTVQVDAYPLAHLLAFIAMVTLTVRRYARDVGPPAPVLDVFLVAVPAALLGAHYVAGVSIAVLLAAMRRRERRPGSLFGLGAALYAATTLGIEFLRDDPGRWFAAGLSHSQWISLALLAVLSATVARRTIVAATATLVLALWAPIARADDRIPSATVVDVLGRALAGRDGGAAVVLGQLLEIGGGG